MLAKFIVELCKNGWDVEFENGPDDDPEALMVLKAKLHNGDGYCVGAYITIYKDDDMDDIDRRVYVVLLDIYKRYVNSVG